LVHIIDILRDRRSSNKKNIDSGILYCANSKENEWNQETDKEVIVVSKKEKFNFENLNMMSFKKGMEKKMGWMNIGRDKDKW